MNRKIRVLIADDEKLARESMRDYLPWEEMGMDIPVCVENGALALDYLCNHTVDIFIMDIRMPVMDGMKLLEKIGEQNLDILILVLSAYDQFEYAQKAIQSRKVFEYVLKPIRRKSFCRLLEKAASEIVRTEGTRTEEGLVRKLERIRNEYLAFVRHHQYDDARACMEKEKQCAGDCREYLEEYRHFFGALYTELQMMALQQPVPAAKELGDYYVKELKTISGSGDTAQLWDIFIRAADELRPYLAAGEERTDRSKTSAVIEHCLEEIKSHYAEPDFSLYRLAEEMQLNANYLSSRFKSEVGMGFVAYINSLRIHKARHLLKDMRYRTSEVSALVGFDNPKYFARVFKKMTGLVPSEYRSRVRNYRNADESQGL